ncbi:hypothetical protein [Maritimibacter alkaliphilus]|uniref:hypothetical protein n=1 Tax=Maritimibacter alkaliphilus TaxID=404236 RepID=UPI001C9760C3|nr:hypothetical protein [Maritimibacter alkaliphilus]MBY6091319.1 hypothetical protein [Maritimibacter alkaliphilus]
MRGPSQLTSLLAAPALLAALAGPASALSCMAPDPATSYTRAAEAAERYVVIEGRLSYDPASMPPVTSPSEAPLERHTTGRIEGKALSSGGFDIPFATEVEMDFTCHGPWCTGNVPQGDAVMFLEQTEAGYRLELTPCGGWHFAEPTSAQLSALRRCHRGQSCG